MAKVIRKNGHGSIAGGRGPRAATGGGGAEAGTTGRSLVLLKDGATDAGVRLLSDKVGLRVARSADFESGVLSADVSGADSVVFEEIGVAVVRGDPSQHLALASIAEDGPFAIVEPERVVYAFGEASDAQVDAAAELLPSQLAYVNPSPLDLPSPPLLTAAAGLVAPAAITAEYLEG